MSRELQREESLFHAARALKTPAERHTFLARECAADATLRQRLEQLLAASKSAETFFQFASPPPAAIKHPKPQPRS
jgi:hypothetical protein